MVEDAIHYFFHCRKFTIERQVFNDMVRVFKPLSIDMILCGNYNLNMKNNRVFSELSTDKYILISVLKPVDFLFEVFLKHILYISKYTYAQIILFPS